MNDIKFAKLKTCFHKKIHDKASALVNVQCNFFYLQTYVKMSTLTTKNINDNNNNNTKSCLSKVENNEIVELKPSSGYFRTPIVWHMVFLQMTLHLLFFFFTVPAVLACNNATYLFGDALGLLTLLGAQVGAHRYYAHRTFRANFPLRLLMVIFQTMSLQQDLVDWVRNHRLHHKFFETDADPHNSKRGFFFSHIVKLYSKQKIKFF